MDLNEKILAAAMAKLLESLYEERLLAILLYGDENMATLERMWDKG